jgi:hypothetical protein
MKKILGLILAGGMFVGCGKEIQYSNDFASAAFINASVFSTPPAGSPTINMHVFVDGLQKTSGNVVYTGSSGYLSVAPGTRRIEVRSSIDTTIKFAESASENFQTNTASTFVLYDTINSAGRVGMLRLTDDLSLPRSGFIKVRFLHLAVTTQPMDVTFVRTSVTPNDSVTISNVSYVGQSPSGAALSTFIEIPHGAYNVRAKRAGTQTLIGSQALSVANLTGTGNITGINTIFATGTAKGQPFRIGLHRNYP